MKISHIEEQHSEGIRRWTEKVTDYDFTYPADFQKVVVPTLEFVTDENYLFQSFQIKTRETITDILRLRKVKQEVQSRIEHGLVYIKDRGQCYKNKVLMEGEMGIGYKITPDIQVSDYFHTHSIREGEDEKAVDLFSPEDLLKMGAQGAERYWLVGNNIVWALVNLYGNRYYYSIRQACVKFSTIACTSVGYDRGLADLITCVNECNYRLFKSEDAVNYVIVS